MKDIAQLQKDYEEARLKVSQPDKRIEQKWAQRKAYHEVLWALSDLLEGVKVKAKRALGKDF